MHSQNFFSHFFLASQSDSLMPSAFRAAFFCSGDWHSPAVCSTALTASYRTGSSGSLIAANRAAPTSGCSGEQPIPARYWIAAFFLQILCLAAFALAAA
jgi:hypothetical protein